jgi:signal transduction histidine kinase
VRVHDNGIGIDRDLIAKERGGHFGVRGMQERAERIGAELNFDSTGSGTEVELIPVRLSI